MKKLRVGLIFGGRSGEHEVSLASAASVYKALDKSKYDVTLIGIDKSGRWVLPDSQRLLEEADNPRLVQLAKTQASYSLVHYPQSKQLVCIKDGGQTPPPDRFDVMIPILHGTYGEDGTIQGLLELAQIPYVGAGVLGSAIGMDKDVAHRLLSQAGIPTVPTLCFHKKNYEKDRAKVHNDVQREFDFPVFVKPANAGSSVGVHKVKTANQLETALNDAFSYDLKVLVQKGLPVRELEVSVLGNEEPKASVVGEVVPTHEFYSYDAKYLDENGAELHIPAKIPNEIAEKVREWAIKAFRVLECRGLARVDFFLHKETNEIYLNEINTIPGFTNISMYPKLWEASGLPVSKLLDELIELALEHHQTKAALKTSFDVKK